LNYLPNDLSDDLPYDRDYAMRFTRILKLFPVIFLAACGGVEIKDNIVNNTYYEGGSDDSEGATSDQTDNGSIGEEIDFVVSEGLSLIPDPALADWNTYDVGQRLKITSGRFEGAEITVLPSLRSNTVKRFEVNFDTTSNTIAYLQARDPNQVFEAYIALTTSPRVTIDNGSPVAGEGGTFDSDTYSRNVAEFYENGETLEIYWGDDYEEFYATLHSVRDTAENNSFIGATFDVTQDSLIIPNGSVTLTGTTLLRSDNFVGAISGDTTIELDINNSDAFSYGRIEVPTLTGDQTNITASLEGDFRIKGADGTIYSDYISLDVGSAEETLSLRGHVLNDGKAAGGTLTGNNADYMGIFAATK